jgi:hypothetical protein
MKYLSKLTPMPAKNSGRPIASQFFLAAAFQSKFDDVSTDLI